LEEVLEREQVEFKIRPTHSSWKRRPLTQPAETEKLCESRLDPGP
jgi:hypothetical protein